MRPGAESLRIKGNPLATSGTVDAVGDNSVRSGAFDAVGAGILSPDAPVVPLRSGVHPAAWNVPGRSGSVGSCGVCTVDGVVELVRWSLSVQDDAGLECVVFLGLGEFFFP